MAEDAPEEQEKTEDPTDERRLDFRRRGEIAYSREISSVFVLVASFSFLSFFASKGFEDLAYLFRSQFEGINFTRITFTNSSPYFRGIWTSYLAIIIPICSFSCSIAILITFLQTKFSFSWSRLKPSWGKLNPLSGLKRMVSSQALMELAKSVGKLFAVGFVSYLILYSERTNIPALMNLAIGHSWAYWASITRMLFWSVAALLLLIAGADFLFNYFTLEKKMKMTKQEVKDEFKQREIDPMIKNRLRRLQRDITNRKSLEATKNATVLITNPTHYSVAIKYEIGMQAPTVIAKGIDFIALEMQKIAKSKDIPLVENKPLARTLYKTTEVDDEIPQSLYKAVSEIIRYVFKIKGIRINS